MMQRYNQNRLLLPLLYHLCLFSPKAGNSTIASGIFIVFLEPSLPVFWAVQTISCPTTSFTLNSMAPSSTNIVEPGFTSLYRFLYEIVVLVLFPNISS